MSFDEAVPRDASELWLVVGPEGGLTEAELARLAAGLLACSGSLEGVVVLGGRLGDYFARNGDSGGHAKAAFIGSLVMTPGMILTPIFPDPQLALVGLALIPFGMAFITVNIVTSMLRVTPNQMRGLAYALLLLAMTFTGMSLGPFLPALITDYVFGNELMLGYSMFIVSLSMTFISNIAFFKCLGAFRAAKS